MEDHDGTDEAETEVDSDVEGYGVAEGESEADGVAEGEGLAEVDVVRGVWEMPSLKTPSWPCGRVVTSRPVTSLTAIICSLAFLEAS